MAAALNPQYRRILLIDDEPGIRKMMSLDLRTDGYEVFTAADGESGLAVFDRELPQIVLTDLKMPGMDGLEVLRRVKQRSPEAEVIVITGHGDLESAIQSLQLRASDFITKPVNSRALEVALDRATERLALRAQLQAYTDDLEAKVAEATAKVVASERLAAVGEVVASLAHSIKNMLTGLKGGAYMVQKGLDQKSFDAVGEGMEMLGRNLRRVANLVGDLLTLSKPRDPNWEEADAAELLQEASQCMGDAARCQKVELVVEPPQPPRIPCRVDIKAIRDSLHNLISNAIDAAAGRPGARVTLRARGSEEEVVWEVADNGPGVAPEALRHLFQGFYSSKGSAGTGLGLMVTDKNAREHGGRVEMENRPGAGATFRMVLPLGLDQDMEDRGEAVAGGG